MTSSADICIDVSNCLEAASLSGIQRVTLELSQALAQLTSVQLLDGRSGRFTPIRPRQQRRLDRLQDGQHHRSTSQRLESRLLRSARTGTGRRLSAIAVGAVVLDIEASWHAPMSRAQLLPRLDNPTAALIHDILPISNPEWFPPVAAERFRAWFDAHRTAGSTLLAISNASADAVAATGAPRPTVIRVGHRLPAETPPGNGKAGPTGVLMVGTIEPRKGHELILDALDQLGSDAPTIDVVGRAGWDTEQVVSRLEAHPNVRWHGSVDNRDLDELWALTGLVLQPSLGEGYGLPVAEAMQRGLPVLSADIAVLAEVGRGQTTLLPLTTSAWADALSTYKQSPHHWPRPEPLDWPTWRDSAHDVLEALRSADLWPDDTSGNR